MCSPPRIRSSSSIRSRTARSISAQLNTHTKSYGNALKAALREDPDVIMVGELRDLETISLAISASETGHLVIGSMNTSSAHKTIDKVIDSYPAAQQNQIRAMLGESLKAVFSQRLLPRADGSGMVLAYELLLGSTQLANLIKDGKTFQIPEHHADGEGSGPAHHGRHAPRVAQGGHDHPGGGAQECAQREGVSRLCPRPALPRRQPRAPRPRLQLERRLLPPHPPPRVPPRPRRRSPHVPPRPAARRSASRGGRAAPRAAGSRATGGIHRPGGAHKTSGSRSTGAIARPPKPEVK